MKLNTKKMTEFCTISATIQKRCFHVNIGKVISGNILVRLLFDFFNGSLLHGPKCSRSRLYDGVSLKGLSHRSSFLFLSRHEPSPSPGPTLKNLRRIPLMS